MCRVLQSLHTLGLLHFLPFQVEILQGEVAALKDLVMTSTPSAPNKHLHPQICQACPKKEKKFSLGHRRSTSHHEFTKEARAQAEEVQQTTGRVKEVSGGYSLFLSPILQGPTQCLYSFLSSRTPAGSRRSAMLSLSQHSTQCIYCASHQTHTIP